MNRSTTAPSSPSFSTDLAAESAATSPSMASGHGSGSLLKATVTCMSPGGSVFLNPAFLAHSTTSAAFFSGRWA